MSVIIKHSLKESVGASGFSTAHCEVQPKHAHILFVRVCVCMEYVVHVYECMWECELGAELE